MSTRSNRFLTCLRAYTHRQAGAARNRNGFTLIELMVVVSIMVIVVGIATPSIIKMMESTRVARGRNLVRGLMTSARAYAVAHRVHAGYRFQKSPRDDRLYAILVYHDANLQARYNDNVAPGLTVKLGKSGPAPELVSVTPALCLFAVAEKSPVRFPAGTDMLQRNFGDIASPYDKAENADLNDVNKANARTFTILFDPTGRPAQVYSVVLRRSKLNVNDVVSGNNLPYDSIFNEPGEVTDGDALLPHDVPTSGNIAVAELAENGLILIDSEMFEATDPNKRYDDYVKNQPVWVLNPYSGSLIEIGAMEEGS